MRVRVATYNVQSFRAGIDVAARVVAAEEPDVLLLQECGAKRVLHRFAEVAGMEVESSNRPFGKVRNAVLSKPPWRAAGVEVGSFTPRGGSPRGFVAVRLRRIGVPLLAVSTHLGLSAPERQEHARELTDWLGGIEGPAVVGVDANEGPDGPAVVWLAGRLFDAFAAAGRGPDPTFPARVPTARIDYIMVSAAVRALRTWVSAVPEVVTASDHRPVVAELELEGSKVEV